MSEKERFKLMMGVLRDHPWLFDRSESLAQLLFEDCKDVVQQGVVFDFLKKFNYFDEQSYHAGMSEIARRVKFISEGIHPSKVVVAGVGMGSESDSSNEAVYKLKTIFPVLGWEPGVLLNTCDRVPQKFKEIGGEIIFLVDEFVGSGQTLRGRYNTLSNRFRDGGVAVPRMVFVLFAGMRFSIESLRQEGLVVEVVHSLERALDGGELQSGVEVASQTLLEIGEKLSSECGKERRDDFGYGGVQALYYRVFGNIPNNVLPLFWWPAYRDMGRRNSLFNRSGMQGD